MQTLFPVYFVCIFKIFCFFKIGILLLLCLNSLTLYNYTVCTEDYILMQNIRNVLGYTVNDLKGVYPKALSHTYAFFYVPLY